MKPGQRKLSEVARHVRRPGGIVSTGWPAVRDRLAQFGIPFDIWQQGAGRLILAKRSDGLYAAGVGGVIISIPRQVGKTYMVGWIAFALCTLFPGLTVIWTAHHTRTSNETFGKMRAMAKKAKVAPYIENVRSTNGEQAVLFKNESRILFGARDQGFGLGFDKVDLLVLDEGQRVKEVAMADMVPATNAAPNGLVIMMGTPPRPTDNGDVFAARRQDALSGDPDTLYLELSADPGSKIIDWDQVAKANPSFPHRTGRAAILRMQKLLGSDEGFYREGYGIWDDVGSSGVVPMGAWVRAARAFPGVGRKVAALEVRTGLEQAFAIGVAATVDGDHDWIDVALYEHGSGVEWSRDYIVSQVRRVLADHRLEYIAMDNFGDGNGMMLPLLEDAGIRVELLNTIDMRNASVGLVDGLVNGRLWHPDVQDAEEKPLTDAARVVGARKSVEGFVFSQARSAGDVTALRAATAAWWVLRKTAPAEYDVLASAY